MRQLEDRISGLTSIRGHHLWAPALRPTSLVVDLGAHRGEFSREVGRRFGSRCVAVEANPTLFAGIEATALLRPLHYAIAGQRGPLRFSIEENPESSHVASGESGVGRMVEVEGITLAELLREERVERVDLLKVDIEGAELPLFDSLADGFLRAVPQITVEFHDFMPELRCGPQVEAVKERLVGLGLMCVVFSAANHGDTLFLNPALLPLSRRRQLYLQHAARYVRGLERRATRLLRGPEAP